MKFQPHRVHPENFEHQVHLDMHPMGLKFVLKVFGRGFGGDSPQCGEMSEGQKGPPLLAEPFLRKVSPDKFT
ncbi:MAG: hypothetical protein E7498_06160 [Ruminococcus sp.]|nr:hypothetical protein [Ruminococcus sp.]